MKDDRHGRARLIRVLTLLLALGAAWTTAMLARELADARRRRLLARAHLRERAPELPAGLPAARGEWRGVGGGRGKHGVVYCVIVGSRVVSFHAQTFDDAPADDLAAAVRAIESVVLQP